MNVQDMSGCWTTASAVETILLNRYLPNKELVEVRKMVEFLLDRQNAGEGWPISVGTQESSTMATGHTIAALSLADDTFRDDAALSARIDQSLRTGLDWLHAIQNASEGWGVEPATEEGKKSSTMATCYALRGYYSSGLTYESSRDIQQAINYLVSKVGADRAWGQREGISSDPASTARVISTLLQCGRYGERDRIVRRARSYLLANKKMWKFKVESYVVAGAPGQVYFHANTLVDVLEALVRCGYFGTEVEELLRFLLSTQDEMRGFWNLRDFQEVDTSIVTWSTAEAIAVIDLAHEAYAEHLFSRSGWRYRGVWFRAFLITLIISLLELLYIVGAHTAIASWWSGLSEGWKQVIVGGVLIGLVVGITANLLSQNIRSALSRIRSRIGSQKEESN